MALMDEFKEERESIKNKSFKEKVGYYWYYYKWRLIVPIIIFIIGFNFISTIVNRPKIILDGMFINITDFNNLEKLDLFTASFVESQELDSSKYHIAYNPNHTYISEEKKATMPEEAIDPSANKYAIQNVVAGLGSKSLNFVIGPADSLLEIDSNQLFADLSEILTEEQQKAYESYYIYLDGEETIPILLDIQHCEELMDLYGDPDIPLAIGIVADLEEMDMMLKFIDYMMN